MSEIGPQDRPVDLEPGGGGRPDAAPPSPPSPPAGSGFDLNQPTIISLLYLSAFVLGVTAIVGVVLAYVWRDQPQAEWEVSHYRYHIRTFWLGLIGSIVSILLLVVLVGVLLAVAVAVLVIVRSVLALLAAQKRAPMPNPDSWLV
jgi:uncharacterized membrane protein